MPAGFSLYLIPLNGPNHTKNATLLFQNIAAYNSAAAVSAAALLLTLYVGTKEESPNLPPSGVHLYY